MKAAIKAGLYIVFWLIAVVSLLSLPLSLSVEEQEQTTVSNVTVNKYIAIGITTNLSAGILFGSLDTGTSDNNATGNTQSGLNISAYNVTITDTNTYVDLCIKDNAALTTAGSTIPNSGFTWNATNATALLATDTTKPWLPGTTFTTSYVVIPGADNVGNNTAMSFRFWLDIQAGQAAGTYNNTVYFKGTVNTTAC